jgi:hypothetical protein
MRLLILTILLLSFGQQAQAIPAYNNGSGLLEECEAYVNNTNVAKAHQCFGYVEGIADLHETFTGWKFMDKKWCLPKSRPNSTQLVRVVVKHLQGHPEELHMTAGSLVSNAFYVAFPCGEGE